jgi:hypothetical protein
MEYKWAKQEIVPRLLDHLAQATAEKSLYDPANTICMTDLADILLTQYLGLLPFRSTVVSSCLFEMLLREPLPQGAVVQEMDKSVVGVLRQLAFEPRFSNAWKWFHKCETIFDLLCLDSNLFRIGCADKRKVQTKPQLKKVVTRMRAMRKKMTTADPAWPLGGCLQQGRACKNSWTSRSLST